MRSPALALAWEFSRRHRWGFRAVALYVLAAGAIKIALGDPATTINPLETERFAFTVTVPLTAAFLFVLVVFTFGHTGDIAARESMFPQRLLALPLTSRALAGWPMLYGMVTVASLWLVTNLLVLRPSGADLPLVWPAVFAAAFLGWAQAVLWLPYGLRGVRVVLAVLWLTAIDVVVVYAVYNRTSAAAMIAFLVPQIPLAFLAARHAVSMARRGAVPDWRLARARRHSLSRRSRPQPRFATAERAQFWYEWRQHGRRLPLLVAILLPFELALLFLAPDVPALVWRILFIVLITPPVMAVFVAPAISMPSLDDSRGMSPFQAARPLTDAALIAAKLKATIASTALTWLLVLVAGAAALAVTDTWPAVRDGVRSFLDATGRARGVVVLGLGSSIFVMSTWKQLVQSLCIALSGRDWLVRSSMFLMLVALVLFVPAAHWVETSFKARAVLVEALPWILVLPVALKLGLGSWVATRLHSARLLSDRTLLSGAALWCVTVLALYALLVWLFGVPFGPRYSLLLIALLLVPLTRLSAAPLALTANRHR